MRITSLFSRLLRVFPAALAGLVLAGSAAGGTITGTVHAVGARAPKSGAEDDGGYGSRRYKFIERVDYDELTDFIVWIDLAVPATALPAPLPDGTIVQRDGTFIPHVLPVIVGTTVQWPNEDTIYHNVFSVSDSTPFDLGLYKSGETPRRIKFTQLGRIDVFCSIHSRMSCIVLVLPNPWFARVDAHGRFTIPGVPAGTYTLKAWHERLPAKGATITVPADGTVTADFVLGFPATPGS